MANGRPLNWNRLSTERKVNYLADYIFGEIPVVQAPPAPEPEPEVEVSEPWVDPEPDMPLLVPSKPEKEPEKKVEKKS
jgi:hypothetical protein